MNRAIAWVASACMAAGLGGCSSPTIKGRVVAGEGSYIIVVPPGDERLSGPTVTGVPGASVSVIMDPGRLNRKVIASGVSDANGDIDLPIDEFGAGFLEIDVAVTARKKDHDPAEGYFRLPGSSRRVLIVMGPGQDRPTGHEREDLSKDVDRFWGGR